MKFSQIYRASFYTMLTLATLVVSVDTSDNKIAMLYPVAVAVVGVLAFLTVDRNPRLGFSRDLANLLALASVALCLIEYKIDEDLMLLALAHWLVYLQLIKMLLPKKVEDDWFLFLVGLVQVLVGGVMSQSDQVGLVLFAWAISALWVLGLFFLHREALRSRIDSVPASDRSTAARDPYPGLLNLAFLLSAFRVMATTLALGGVIFLVMPRRMSMGGTRLIKTPAKHLTGFDDQVKLGQLGEILENDSIVMSVEFVDQKDARIRPVGEPLFRGVTMTSYRRGRWLRQNDLDITTFPTIYNQTGRAPKIIQQRIKLEPTDSPVLFGIRPMHEVILNRRFSAELNAIDGTIHRAEMRRGPLDYVVESDADATQPQPGESFPDSYRLVQLLEINAPLRSSLRSIAEPIVSDIPEKDWAARGRALEAYLRDSHQFGYSLRMSVVDPNLDPVEDFLINRKEGHCEYFASSLALMLRSVGVPARVVNGFKGGDWNELAQVMNVRQKHAHSWVEALVGRWPNGEPNWLTLDPTPGTERDLSVAQVGGFSSNFRQVTDLVRYAWAFYVVGFNSERQNRLIYQPVRDLIEEARLGYQVMGERLRSAAARVLYFPNVNSLISFRGFLVTFLGLLGLAGLLRVFLWIWRRLVRSIRGVGRESAALPAGVLFYRRLAKLLAAQGLERLLAETQYEFALRASDFLAGRGPMTERVAKVPQFVVEAFYRVRFGHLDLDPSTLLDLETRLDELEAGLRAAEG